MPSTAVPHRARRSLKRRRGAASSFSGIMRGFALGVLAALVLAGGAMALVQHFAYGPVAPVREYLEALDDGRGGQARAIAHARIPDADAAMLDDDALRTATESLGRFRYEVIEQQGDTATVRAHYRINDAETSTDFQVRRTGDSGLMSTWEMEPITLPVITVDSEQTRTVTLNGVKVGLPAGKGRYVVYYPGVFTAEYSSALLDAEGTTTTVTGPDPQASQLTVQVHPSDEVQEQARRQVREHLEQCAAQDTLFPPGCPFEFDFSGRVNGDVHWEITDWPKPELTLDDDGQWHLEDAQGTATISFDALDLYTGQTTALREDVPFTVHTTVRAGNDAVTLAFD